MKRYARVAVPLGVRGTFTYAIPDDLLEEVEIGVRVEVPWGARLTTGFVVALSDQPEVDVVKVREIHDVLDGDEPALLPEILELCTWAADYYLAPLGVMLRVALPANMSSRGKRVLKLDADEGQLRAALTRGLILEADLEIVEAIRSGVTDADRLLRTRKRGRPAVRRLRGAGLLSIDEFLRDARGVRFDRWVVLARPEEDLPPKRQAIVDALRASGCEALHSALVEAGLSASSISTLERRGVVRVEQRPRRHSLDAFFSASSLDPLGELNYSTEQLHAIESVKRALGEFRPFLLQGVTGSGKTEVYIEIMREAVGRGDQAIVLVPEISLTPALAARLKERFGERVAILHSSLSPSERYDQWWRARRGEVDVAIGPRSALFTPFPRLGVIIVDEEGDGAYKQDEVPRYNARDLAVVRARIRGIPVVLGSATPSLESRANAERGRYTMLKLAKRVEARPLPEVEIIDIRGERGDKDDKGMIMFGQRLREELGRVFEAGEQAIILMNRRGYAPFLLCRECEHEFRCRDCSVTLTVHRRAGLLVCHYCGYRIPMPACCPLCGGEVLQPIGFGTEKVEERFRAHFPGVPAEVLDRDSIRRKGELVRILDRFRRGDTRALIGTQMLSKGHHFPGVTLTAVINADAILGYPDFRSAEKTFYLLTQVAGRSGRGELAGRVAIQSAFPHHYALQHVRSHDYDGFFESEIEFRRRFRYPPTTGMIAILFRGEHVEKVEAVARRAGQRLEKEVADLGDARLQGPAPAPLARIKGVYRYQLLARSAKRAALRSAVERVVTGLDAAGVDVILDVDPLDIL
jgi:primosomal protein N' (replication factor Y) (superfamily II helicase)